MNLNEWCLNTAANLLNEDTTSATTIQKLEKPAEYEWLDDKYWDEMPTEDKLTWIREVPLDDVNWRDQLYTKDKVHKAFCAAFDNAKKENPVPLTWCPDMYTKGFDTFTFGCEDNKYKFDVYNVPEKDPLYGKSNICVFIKDPKRKYPENDIVSCFYVPKDTIPNEAKTIFRVTKRLFNDGLEKFNSDNGYTQKI